MGREEETNLGEHLRVLGEEDRRPHHGDGRGLAPGKEEDANIVFDLVSGERAPVLVLSGDQSMEEAVLVEVGIG